MKRGTDPEYARRIARYYDRTQVLYARLWSRRNTHYGLSGPGIRSHRQALRNLDRFVSERLALLPGGRVLDAGCGVGGTALHLAEQRGLSVVGITLSRVQARRARARLSGSAAGARVLVCRSDYLATAFADGTFDGFVAIESACYAEPKRALLGEACRLLRPGGRLVVSDGFLARPPVGAEEELAYERFLQGFALQGLATVEEFAADLEKTGFRDIRCDDCQHAIMPSARRIVRLSRIGVAVCWWPSRAGWFPREWLAHGHAGLSQHLLFQRGVLRYVVYSATRPGMD